MTGLRTLRHLLDNAEIMNSISIDEEDEEDEGKGKIRGMKFDKKEEMKVIAYIQAVSQVILNISSSNPLSNKHIDPDTVLKLIAATISVISEYLIGNTFKVQRAATSALKLIMSHGLVRVKIPPHFQEH
jgi:hypothetical protein